MRFLKVLSAFCAVLTVSLSPAAVQAQSKVSLRTGEISFDGRLLSITASKKTLIMQVVRFTLPNGKSAALKTPKSKTVVFAASQFMDGSKKISAAQLKRGEMITAIGLDSGTGAPLRARVILKNGGVSTSVPVPQAQATPVKVEPQPQPVVLKHEDLLPAPYDTGDMKITIADLGFDYSNRVIPNFSDWVKTPNYFCIFQFTESQPGVKPDSSRMTIRRAVGPAGQLLRDFQRRPIRNEPDKMAFVDSRIDPRWEYIDVDVDIKPQNQNGTSDLSGGSITLDSLPLPAVGQEIPINREFVGGFGTKFTILKIKRAPNGKDFIVVWQHEFAPNTVDVSITGYSYKLGNRSSGNGGLFYGTRQKADHELTLYSLEGSDSSKLEFKVVESAPTRENREGFQRHRFRLPVSKTLQTRPVQIKPEAILPTLSSASVQNIEVKAESSGISSSATTGALWVKSQASDVKRGLFWKPLDGKANFDGANKPVPVYFPQTSSYNFFWHGDGTPADIDENAAMFNTNIPTTTKTYDAELRLEQKLRVESNFCIQNIPVPSDGAAPTKFEDQSENTLLLRKMVRYNSAKDIARYLNYGETPLAGLALVFEKSPLMTDSQFVPQPFDVEDNNGRSLRVGYDMHRPFFPGDLTLPKDAQTDSRFFTMFVAVAPDSQTLSVWMKTIETANQGKEMTVQLRDIPNERYKEQ